MAVFSLLAILILEAVLFAGGARMKGIDLNATALFCSAIFFF